MKRFFAIFLATLLGVGGGALPASSAVNPNVLQYQGHGPSDGEFSAWTKLLANGTQVKLYAKYPQLGQKIQFVAQNASGVYEEIAWLRIEPSDLNEDGSYSDLQNFVYLIRTVDLKPGKNRFRVIVDGKNVTGTKTYVQRPASPTSEESPGSSEAGASVPQIPESSQNQPSVQPEVPEGNPSSPPSSDSELPVIDPSSGVFSKTVLSPGEEFTVSYRITDDFGCCNPHDAWLYQPDGSWVDRSQATRVSGSIYDGIYRATLQIPLGAAAGTYSIRSQATDFAGKYTHLQLLGTVEVR